MVSIYRSVMQGRIPKIRKIPGLDSIKEAVSRAVEMGGSIQYTSGQSKLSDIKAVGGLIASAGILKYVSALAAEKGAKLHVTVPWGDVLLLFESVTKEGFAEANKLEDWGNLVEFHYGGGHPRSYQSRVIGVLRRDNVKSQLYIGSTFSETAVVLGAGLETGCYQIGGSDQYARLPIHVITATYTFIGEELYAAGAYISKDPLQLGVIRGQDVSRFIIIAFLVLGTILMNLGARQILNFI